MRTGKQRRRGPWLIKSGPGAFDWIFLFLEDIHNMLFIPLVANLISTAMAAVAVSKSALNSRDSFYCSEDTGGAFFDSLKCDVHDQDDPFMNLLSRVAENYCVVAFQSGPNCFSACLNCTQGIMGRVTLPYQVDIAHISFHTSGQ